MLLSLRPGSLDEQVAGYVTSYAGGGNPSVSNFTFATVKGSGHMVPQYQPKRGMELFRSFITVRRRQAHSYRFAQTLRLPACGGVTGLRVWVRARREPRHCTERRPRRANATKALLVC